MTTFVTQMSSNHPNNQLIKELQEGSEEALSKLYDIYSEALYGLILRIVNDDLLAQDILQECFVKIWQKAKLYSPAKGTFFTWALNICRNRAIDELRKKKRESDGKKGFENVPQFESHVKSMNVDAIGLSDLLKTLSKEQQFVLELLYFQGYTQQEIADEHDIPLGTVKTRARSALKHLREIFILLLLFWILKHT